MSMAVPLERDAASVDAPAHSSTPTYRLLLGGPEAAEILRVSGLLRDAGTIDGKKVPECPVTVDDVLKIAGGPRSLVLIGYDGPTPFGYIIAQIHEAERGETHLFIRQAVGGDRAEWNRDAMAFLVESARAAGMDAVTIILPTKIARAFGKRYGFGIVGTYEVKRLSGNDAG